MAPPQQTLEDILQDFQQGHDREGSFRALFTLFYPQVHRFFLRKRMPPEDCRDLTQDVFLSVYKGLGAIQDATHFKGWLFTIARNAFVNELTKRHAKKRSGIQVMAKQDSNDTDFDAFPSSASEDALESMLDRERTEKLTEALSMLPQQMRRCVQLRVAEDSTYEEIAAVMGISVNTVKAHLHKARKSLQEKLGSYFRDLSRLSPEDG
jgi:RNA polymerase sigma-70 factor (ECF subfamily)